MKRYLPEILQIKKKIFEHNIDYINFAKIDLDMRISIKKRKKKLDKRMIYTKIILKIPNREYYIIILLTLIWF